MELWSDAFENGEAVPEMYTCDGENINPPLHFSDFPEGTESLAIMVEDPDAPSGDFTHWIIWNIPPDTREILEAEVPVGAVQGMNDSGNLGYTGPCPPEGEHRYFFRAYALDVVLKLDEGAEQEDLQAAMEDHILDEAELVGIYSRG